MIPANTNENLMTKKILVVDDDDLIRSLVTHTLQLQQYTVIAAATGPAGVEAYQAETPNLVVLDIAMPGMSGIEVASKIRDFEREQKLSHVPIIVFTAYARSFMSSGQDDLRISSYLTKPVSPEQLLKHVNSFLEQNDDS